MTSNLSLTYCSICLFNLYRYIISLCEFGAGMEDKIVSLGLVEGGLFQVELFENDNELFQSRYTLYPSTVPREVFHDTEVDAPACTLIGECHFVYYLYVSL